MSRARKIGLSVALAVAASFAAGYRLASGTGKWWVDGLVAVLCLWWAWSEWRKL